MPYETQPGTIPHRAVEHLRTLPEGTELPSSVFAEALGIRPDSLTPCLESPLKYGLLKRRQVTGERGYRWSLGDGTPLEHEQEELLPQRIVLTSALLANRSFEVWLSDRGTLRLHGVQLAPDGCVELSPEQTNAVKRLVTGAAT